MIERIQVNGREYPVLKLLGKGKGGYSYLALSGEEKVVVKQIHHEPCDYYQFGDKLAAELGDYRRLREVGLPPARADRRGHAGGEACQGVYRGTHRL